METITILTNNLTSITSFGSTGVSFNYPNRSQFNEEFDTESFDEITNFLDDNGIDWEWKNTHKGEEDMPQDEWTITIK